MKPFREAGAPIVQFLSDEECRRLVNACEGAFRDLVRAALLTGCRYGELTRMRGSDFNPEAGTITVQVSKAGKPRHVALTDEGRACSRNLLAGHAGLSLIFTRDDGKTWGASHQQRPFETASKRARSNRPRHSTSCAIPMPSHLQCGAYQWASSRLSSVMPTPA